MLGAVFGIPQNRRNQPDRTAVLGNPPPWRSLSVCGPRNTCSAPRRFPHPKASSRSSSLIQVCRAPLARRRGGSRRVPTTLFPFLVRSWQNADCYGQDVCQDGRYESHPRRHWRLGRNRGRLHRDAAEPRCHPAPSSALAPRPCAPLVCFPVAPRGTNSHASVRRLQARTMAAAARASPTPRTATGRARRRPTSSSRHAPASTLPPLLRASSLAARRGVNLCSRAETRARVAVMPGAQTCDPITSGDGRAFKK